MVLVMLVAAVAALTTALTVRERGTASWQRVFAETSGAHAWFYGEPGADLSPIAQREGVAGVAGPYEMSRIGVPVSGPGTRGTVVLQVWLEGLASEMPAVGRPLLTSGQWLSGAPREVVLAREFAATTGIKVGDTITARTTSGDHSLRVVGLALSSGRSPLSSPTIAYATKETVQSTGTLDPGGLSTALGVRLVHKDDSRAFMKDAATALPAGSVFFSEDWHDVVANNDETTSIVVLFLGIFSVFALLASGFVIANAIGGRVLAQFRDIGLLKAIGFTPRQVTVLLLLEHAGLAVIASVVGIAIGTLLAPLLDGDTAKAFETSSTPIFDPVLALSIAAGTIGMVVLATVIPAWRGGRVSVVQAISQGFARVATRPSRVARAAAALRLPVIVVLGVKDAFARPLRAWLTVAALTLTVVTATFTLSADVTIRHFFNDPALIGEPIDAELEAGPAYSLDRVEALVRTDPDVETYFLRGETTELLGTDPQEARVIAVGPGYERVHWVVRQGRLFSAPGEAVAGQGFLNLLDLKVGDTIQLAVRGQTLTLRIVGQYLDTDDGGRSIMFGADTVTTQTGSPPPFTAYAVHLRPGASVEAFQQRAQASAGRRLSFRTWDHSVDGADAIRTVLYGLTALLLFVGAVSLLNTTMLGTRERLRDIGVLKAVGFTPRQVAGSVVSGAALLAVAAAVVGIPAGVWVSIAIVNAMGNSLGWGPGLLIVPPPAVLAAILPALVLIGVLATLAPAVAAARTRTADVLRSE
jgi:putative ABC transport system permease protein